MLSWPLTGHVALALATGLVCGIATAHYPVVISPPYAAILGTLGVYPAMVAMWWRLNRPRKHGR
jgi:xanthosine utilization system XapX-like protein